MFPCAYILLTGKDENIYKLTLQEIINYGLANKLYLRPEEILTDFELSIINIYSFFFQMLEFMAVGFILANVYSKNYVKLL